jgi:hypothetical protein
MSERRVLCFKSALPLESLFAPKGTPKDIINKLNAAVADALGDANVRKRLADLGQEIPPRDQQTPEAWSRLSVRPAGCSISMAR